MDDLNVRIIAWGREGMALVATQSGTMNERARECRLTSERLLIIRRLDEGGFFGAASGAGFGSPRMMAIGELSASLEAAIRDHLRRGGVERLLLAYDSAMRRQGSLKRDVSAQQEELPLFDPVIDHQSAN